MNGSNSSGSISFGCIKEDSRKNLVNLLNKHEGVKVLVWDGILIERFSLIAEYSLFKDHDAKSLRYLNKSLNTRIINPSQPPAHLIFIVRPELSSMDTVAECVRRQDANIKHKGVECHLYFVPSKSFLCVQKLEELGVYGTFNTVDEYRLDLIALDSDIVSMEYQSAFSDLNLDEAGGALFHAAKSLVTIQKHFGIIPSIYGKGVHAQQVVNLMQKLMCDENDMGEEDPSQIDRLLIIDRTSDLITPMLTQLTYEGLIDEAFGINNTTTLLPPEKFSNLSKSDEVPTEKKKVLLTSRDQLYGCVRDCNFSAVGKKLKTEAEILTTKFEERHHIWSDLKEARQFVSKIPQMNQIKASLATHLSIAELVKEFTDTDDFLDGLSCEQELTNNINTDRVHTYIEECIMRKKPLDKLLRLLCLQSICNNGLKPKILDSYKREIIQTYGYKHLTTLHRLEACGLLVSQLSAPASNYNTLRKSLRLTVEEVNEREPTDISYVYSGYAPMSVRLAQILSHPAGWRSIEEVLKLIPGNTINYVQQTNKANNKWSQQQQRANPTTTSTDSSCQQLVTLVYFIGGVTYAELSAFRYLTSKTDDQNEYVMATTDIINGSSLINQLIQK